MFSVNQYKHGVSREILSYDFMYKHLIVFPELYPWKTIAGKYVRSYEKLLRKYGNSDTVLEKFRLSCVVILATIKPYTIYTYKLQNNWFLPTFVAIN